MTAESGGIDAVHHRCITRQQPTLISIGSEVLGQERAAFTVVVTSDDGRRIVENVIVEHRDGRITRPVDVEASDRGAPPWRRRDIRSRMTR